METQTESDSHQASLPTTSRCLLWDMPTEILDIIFEFHFNDPGWKFGELGHYRGIHLNKLLRTLTPLPPRDNDGSYYWGWMHNKDDGFPKELAVSNSWCRFAMRSWIKTRSEIYISLDNIKLQDISRLKPKIWTTFRSVTFDVGDSERAHDPTRNINDGLQEVFRTFPRLETLTIDGVEDLLDDFEGCLHWFPDKFGRISNQGDRPTVDILFGNIPWVKALLRHKQLRRVTFPPCMWCEMPWDLVREPCVRPDYRSAEMREALECLEEYVNDKLEEQYYEALIREH